MLYSTNQHNIVNINKLKKRKFFLAYFLVSFTVLSRPTSVSVFEPRVFQVGSPLLVSFSHWGGPAGSQLEKPRRVQQGFHQESPLPQ